ncbi:MAG: hypothetical protein WAL83_03005 [Arenicellales bacterium]
MKAAFGIIVASIILSLALAWTFRYDIVVGTEPLVVYSMDRWTGEVSFIAPRRTVESMSDVEFSHTPIAKLGNLRLEPQ